MDIKTESKILLTALATAPTLAGIVLAVNGEAMVYGLLLIIFGFGVMILLWQPWKWFQKKGGNK